MDQASEETFNPWERAWDGTKKAFVAVKEEVQQAVEAVRPPWEWKADEFGPPKKSRESSGKVIDGQFEQVFSKLIKAESQGVHSTDGKLTTSGVGAEGITQLMRKTAQNPGYGVTPVKDKSEAEYLRFGRDYLKAMLNEFGGDYRKALAAYNAGPGNVKEAIAKGGRKWEDHLPKKSETLPYIEKILGNNVQKDGFYSDTRLQREYPTLAKDSEKSVNTFMKEVSQSSPEYGSLQDFLTNMRAFPNIKITYNPDVRGTFTTPGFFRERGSDLTSRGEIALSRSFVEDGTLSDDAKVTLVHEMTHAAERQIGTLAERIRTKKSRSKDEERFLESYKKYTEADSDENNRYRVFSAAKVIAKKIAPDWYAENEKKYDGYRTGTGEMIAHATGYSSKPEFKGEKAAPEHVDSSIATEFFVLLDLANRVSIDNTPKGR